MPHHPSSARLQRSLRYRGVLAIVVAGALCGCSIWDRGPEPDNYVGPARKAGPRPLTDPDLRAVTPDVPGDHAEGAATLPAAMNPATMPGAWQLPPNNTGATSTQPATRPNIGTTTPDVAPVAEIPPALSVQEAIIVGLQNNTNLHIQRYDVPLARLNEDQALSAFDPSISGGIQGGRTQRAATPDRAAIPPTDPPIPGNSGIVDSVRANVSATEYLPTGTTVTGSLSSTNSFYTDSSSGLNASLTVTQALLRGAGLEVNLVSLRQAEIATRLTQYQLRGIAESLVADIETTYWDLAYAERQVIIVQNSVDVAQKQFEDTQGRTRIGTLALSELPAAQAQLASRQEDLINAKSSLESVRLRLMSLLTPAPHEFWNRGFALTTLPFIPTGNFDPVDSHVAVALRFRPDVNQTKLQIQRGDLDVVRTKNGLLPRLDLFLTLGKTTLAENFGNSFTGINGPDYSALVGVNFDIDPINRSENASYRSALLNKEQLKETLDNTYQTVQLDVRTQYLEVERTRKQIDATRATRIAQQETLRAEEGKLTTGKGTALLVSIAQRDLLVDQLTEVQSITNHLKSLVTLYRLEGSLLYRRGIDAPGANPVDGPAWRH